MKRIILTGGGTAGHVTPQLALIPLLLEQGWDVHYIGTANGIEQKLITAIPGVTYHAVSSGKLRRYFSVSNFIDPFRVVKGIIQSARVVRQVRPSIVFSKGGFVSVPVVYGAGMHRVPVLIHESDMTPGLANRLSKPLAKEMLCTFPETARQAGPKAICVGAPIRKELLSGRREDGLRIFGFTPNRPVLLVIGGSSGAQAINRAVRKALPELTQCFQVLHVCGMGNADSSVEGTRYYCQREYLKEDMAAAYACADIILSRAGSNTLCEILALRKPALLIPYPKEASRGDQIVNALSFEKRGFSRVLMQEDMTPDLLAKRIVEVYRDRGQMIDAMEREPSSNGVKRIMEEIARFAKG